MATADRLIEAQNALHELVTGGKPVKIKKDGREIEFAPANKAQLEHYIQSLKSELGTHRRRPAGVR